jgi:hypothetical protein
MRLTLKSKVVLLALITVVLFALALSGAAAKVLQNLAAQEVEETRERPEWGVSKSRASQCGQKQHLLRELRVTTARQ